MWSFMSGLKNPTQIWLCSSTLVPLTASYRTYSKACAPAHGLKAPFLPGPSCSFFLPFSHYAFATLSTLLFLKHLDVHWEAIWCKTNWQMLEEIQDKIFDELIKMGGFIQSFNSRLLFVYTPKVQSWTVGTLGTPSLIRQGPRVQQGGQPAKLVVK